MEKIRVSCVSYLNSQPFIYGLKNSAIHNEIELSLDTPSECADKIEEGKVDIGLAPVAVLPELEKYQVISEYCIGSNGEVGSVVLLSEVPLNEIKTVLLDYQSRTSVMLAQVLAEKFWKIKPEWKNAEAGFEKKISGNVAGVLIGDRTFPLKEKFSFVHDLGAEWKKYTNLPFVFACWVSNKELPKDFVRRFNEALRYGLFNIEALAKQTDLKGVDAEDYFNRKISYAFDGKKKFALELFLKYSEEVSENELMKIV